MIKNIFLAVILLFSLFSLPANADFVVKDAVYFMKDDNVFSSEEMDEEAQFVYEECQKNLFQRRYFDCGCIAGAFRQKRDEVKHTVPQTLIIQSLVNGKAPACTNKEMIAGDTYTYCQDYSSSFRSFKKEEENESYCKCAANKMASAFAEKPIFNLDYIRDLRLKIMSRCK